MSKKTKEATIELFYLNRKDSENTKNKESNLKEEQKKKNKEQAKKRKEKSKLAKKQKKEQDKIENKKIKGIEKNKKQIQKEKKKKQARIKKSVLWFVLKFTSLCILVIATIILLLTTPLFNLKYIEVIGNEKISYDEIVSLSKLNLNDNIFKNSKSSIIESIQENPYIASVDLKRKLPNKMQIIVEERKKVFALEILNSYAYIDTQGYILEISEEKEKIPVIKGYKTTQDELTNGTRLNQEDLTKLGDVLKIMEVAQENDLKDEISMIDITNTEDYLIYLEEHKKLVHLGNVSNLSNKMLYVNAIIKEETAEGEIFVNGNLNSGFQPYFRAKV